MPKYVVIAGDFFDGIWGTVGPFDDYAAAEKYMEMYNMGHVSKSVIELDPPPTTEPRST